MGHVTTMIVMFAFEGKKQLLRSVLHLNVTSKAYKKWLHTSSLRKKYHAPEMANVYITFLLDILSHIMSHRQYVIPYIV